MKIVLNHLVLIIFSLTSALFSQISSNPFISKSSLNSEIEKSNGFKYDLDNHLNEFINDSIVVGIDVNGGIRTGVVDYYENYNDPVNYLMSPFLHYKTSKNITLDVRANFENIRDDYVYPDRIYWADTFIKHRGTFDIAKVSYTTDNFNVKFGRDYFLPGVYFYENLLFSKYNYSYDQLGFEYHNKHFTISSYYLNPGISSDSLGLNYRHINIHRITVNLGNGYLAFNDVMLYGGHNTNLDIIAFNPLILMYPYRKNKKHLDGNNIMSLELYYSYSDYFIFMELLLDDWQADNKVPTDLEPTEWGINSTFGIKKIADGVDWKINYTRVANRTFNAPRHYHEKFIHKNYPIGHFLGNNFWEAKTSLIYVKGDFISDLTISHLEYGDEALYGEFNTDFESAIVSEGYTEDFPFGRIKKQTGLTLKNYYNISDNLLINGNFGYWFNNSRLENDMNISLNIGYRLKVVEN